MRKLNNTMPQITPEQAQNAILEIAMDNVAKEEYGAIGWFMLTEQQQSYLVKKVALEYHRLLTEE